MRIAATLILLCISSVSFAQTFGLGSPRVAAVELTGNFGLGGVYNLRAAESSGTELDCSTGVCVPVAARTEASYSILLNNSTVRNFQTVETQRQTQQPRQVIRRVGRWIVR